MSHEVTPARHRIWLVGALLALFCALAVGISVGSTGFDGSWLHASLYPYEHNGGALILRLRASRVLLAALTGAGLCAAGAALQALLRNPLADPFIIGVSGGAALGGSIAVAIGAAATFSVATGSMVGALLSSFALAIFVARDHSAQGDTTLLLGVVFNAFAAALISFMKTLLPAERSQALLFWLVGTLSPAPWSTLLQVGATVFAALAVLWWRSGELDLLSLGDEEASRLGVNVKRVRLESYVAASLLVGALVPLSGMIGFIGLVVPHAVRALVGPDMRLLLPVATALGAALLVVFDALSRGMFVVLQTEVPVGALTALIGAPMFGWLLLRRMTRSKE